VKTTSDLRKFGVTLMDATLTLEYADCFGGVVCATYQQRDRQIRYIYPMEEKPLAELICEISWDFPVRWGEVYERKAELKKELEAKLLLILPE